MLANAPGEDEAAEFFGCRRTPGDDLEFVFGDSARICILQEQSAGDVFDDRARGCVADFDEAEILFCGKTFACFRRKGRRGDGFDKELGDFGCGLGIDGTIDANDSAECGDGIAGEGFLVRLEDGAAGGGAAGVGVLDDDDGRLVKFLREFPAGVEVDEVVEAELFALKLRCTGDAEAGTVGVERGTLVGVFAIARATGPAAY